MGSANDSVGGGLAERAREARWRNRGATGAQGRGRSVDTKKVGERGRGCTRLGAVFVGVLFAVVVLAGFAPTAGATPALLPSLTKEVEYGGVLFHAPRAGILVPSASALIAVPMR